MGSVSIPPSPVIIPDVKFFDVSQLISEAILSCWVGKDSSIRYSLAKLWAIFNPVGHLRIDVEAPRLKCPLQKSEVGRCPAISDRWERTLCIVKNNAALKEEERILN